MSSTSDTINIKGNRKVVRAIYEVESVFRIPDGVDLEDKTVVKSWYVNHNSLMIEYVGERGKHGVMEDAEPAHDAFGEYDGDCYRIGWKTALHLPTSRVEISSDFKWKTESGIKTMAASGLYKEEDKVVPVALEQTIMEKEREYAATLKKVALIKTDLEKARLRKAALERTE